MCGTDGDKDTDKNEADPKEDVDSKGLSTEEAFERKTKL